MTDRELVEKTQETICELYQNREHEAVRHIVELLPEYQKIAQLVASRPGDENVGHYLLMLKELVEHYQAQDILGMADCLAGKALPILAHNQKENTSFVPEKENVLEIDENIGIDKAEGGSKILSMKFNGRDWRLNSKLNPQRAAKVYAERYKIRAYGIYFVFGLSDGRYVRELLRECDETNSIIVCEPDVRIFKVACSQFELSDILEDNRVHLYIPGVTVELEDVLQKAICYSETRAIEFCILPGYDIIFREICMKTIDTITEQIMNEAVRRGTSMNFNRMVPQNTLFNMKHMLDHKNIVQLKRALEGRDLTAIPAIIVSAGPSLDKNVQELKKAEGKALIIVVDAALRTVIRAGIHPDIICTIDAKVPERFFDGMDLNGMVWCCDRTTKPEILRQYSGTVYYYGFFEKAWGKLLDATLGYSMHDLPSGGNITSIAFSLVSYLGFRKIVLVGQDMAFTNGQSHTSGINGALGDNKKYIESRWIVQVEGIDGTMLDTDFQMWYYKKWFEKMIQINEDTLKVIDATEGGARIEGAEIRKLSEVIEEYCKETFDFLEIEPHIPTAFDTEQKAYLMEHLLSYKEQVANLKKTIENAMQRQTKILHALKEERRPLDEVRMDLEWMLQDNVDLEQMPLFDMMTLYAQKEEYEMGDAMYENAQMDIEELVEQSLKLYEGYSNAVNMLVEDIRDFIEK